MCGIFATTNQENSAQAILNGLKQLEYRGYDSWGITVKGQKKLRTEKHIGKISQSQTRLPGSTMGIGHTRWATHGEVTVKNAHPHTDCDSKIAIVHNGIIDNWQALKKTLKNHQFSSQTDSEIIAHLIEEELKRHSDLFKAAKKTFEKLHGFNAVLIIHQDFPYLVAIKNGSPLVIGYNPSNHLVSSDIPSLLSFTKKVVILEDNEVAKISKDHIQIQSITSNKNKKIKPIHIKWSTQTVSKGKYQHFMIKEIFEQPDIIKKLAQSKIDQTEKLARLIKKSKGIFTIACGSAAHAALAGQYFFSRIAQEHINPAIGSEFYYHSHFLNKDSLCITLSQSGETIDTIQSFQHAKKTDSHTASLVNIPHSTLDRLSDFSIYLEVGTEKAVASTKAFIAKLVILLMTAHQLNKDLNSAKNELKLAVKATKNILHTNFISQIKQLSKKLKNHQSIFIIGKGQSYPAALEIALKIKEISYIHAEGFPSGELKHGVLALIKKDTPVIVLAPQDETYHDVISAAMEIKARKGQIIGISNRPNIVFDTFLKVSNCHNATIIPNIVVGQLLAYYLATAKGLDPDMPRNLAKSVTVK